MGLVRAWWGLTLGSSKMTTAVTRARELRCLRLESSGVSAEARLLQGSDDANGDSGHGSDEGWEGQPWARRLRQWDWTQGTLGGGKYEVSFWLNPSQV